MTGIFDNTTVYRIQEATDIVDLISEHVNLTRKGKEMVGLCPFHDDHRPSMNVNSTKQIFKCFACGAGGDVFKFVQMRENLTFPQAVERLAQRAGIKLEAAKRTKSQTEEIDPNKLARLNKWAAGHFCHNLFNSEKGKDALKYLEKRQFPIQIIKKWKLGLALESGKDLINAAKAKKIPMKLLAQAGLVAGRQGGIQWEDKFINRLMFTITDVTGRVIGFGGRALGETGAKYINSPATPLFDKSNSLYGLEQARGDIVSQELAVVVEGYTDCIMAHSEGCKNVVASLGTSFTTGQARILRRYAKTVVLVFDGDTAGKEAANRAMEVCLSEHIDIKLAVVPDGRDPCDFLLTAGKDEFQELIKNALDVFECKWNRLREQFDHDETLTGRKRAVEEFFGILAATMQSAPRMVTDRGLVSNKLSNLLGLSPKQINAELSKRLERTSRRGAQNVENQKAANLGIAPGLSAVAQREILEVLLNEPALFKKVRQKITVDAFDKPILRQIATLVFERLSEDPWASCRQIIANNESVELSGAMAEIIQTGERKGNFEPRLESALEVLQRQKKTSEIKTIKDERKRLRSIAQNAGEGNHHIIGMT
ncbi:DNA primase [Planctomycetota bacterium]